MSLDVPFKVLEHILNSYYQQIPVIIGLAVLFTALALWESQQSSKGKVWWRNPGLTTDLTYALVHGLLGPYFRVPVLLVIALTLMAATGDPNAVTDYYQKGRGPLSTLPFYAQVAVYIIATDFLHYWIHRFFHNARMWRFHAIHHSATQVEWTTTYRSHPINIILQPAAVVVVMLCLGISAEVVVFTLPFDIITAAWVHSNLKWDLGPFKYVFAGPVFHRWHHGQPGDGGDMNFAPTFSLWDYMFGTFYMPEGRLPDNFGTDDHHFPEGYLAQLLYPFKIKPRADAVVAGPPVPAE